MLNKLLSQSNQKHVVGISLTPCAGLEAVILDKNTRQILKYGRRKVEYNFSTREVADYIELKSELKSLFDELQLPPKTMVYFSLPNVLFDFITTPNLSSEEIKTAILSKAEDFYLFKKEDPISGYCEVYNPEGNATKKYAYTSFQANVVEELKNIINKDLGMQLIGIESNFTTCLRGCYITGLINDVILEEASWTLMLINTNSFALFNMDGKNIIDYSETPVAIKSLSAEEAYQTIATSASQSLSKFNPSKLYIISETDDIGAQVLKNQIDFDHEIITVNTNKYSKKSLLDVLSTNDFNEAATMTLTAIGASVQKTDFGLNLNVLKDDPSAITDVYFTKTIFGQEVDVTAQIVKNFCFAMAIAIGMLLGILYGFIYFINQKFDSDAKKYKSQIENLESSIEIESKKQVVETPEVDIISVIDEIANLNVTAINFYDSISSDIPKNVWLTKYYNKDGSYISVKGIAQNVVDIYEYYKNLKAVSPNSNIKLEELKVVTYNPNDDITKYLSDLVIDQDTDRLYSFEISNTQINYILKNSPEDIQKRKLDEINILLKGSSQNNFNNNVNIEQTSEQMEALE